MAISHEMAKLGAFPPRSAAFFVASLAFIADAPQSIFLGNPKLWNCENALTQGMGLWPFPRRSLKFGASPPHSLAFVGFRSQRLRWLRFRCSVGFRGFGGFRGFRPLVGCGFSRLRWLSEPTRHKLVFSEIRNYGITKITSLAIPRKIGEISDLPAPPGCVFRGFVGSHSRRSSNRFSRNYEITKMR